MTIARFTLVMEDGRILAAPGHGRILRSHPSGGHMSWNPPGAALNVLWICAMPGAETERIGWQVNMVTRSRP